MLPKTHRIRKSAEYTNVFKRSQKLQSEHFKIYVNFSEPNNLNEKEIPSSKLGIIIPAKLTNAANRNHLKRQIRDILHHPIKETPGINLVIKASKYNEALSFENLKIELKNTLSPFLKL